MGVWKRTARSLLVTPPVPKALSRRFRAVPPEQLRSVEEALREHHFSTRPAGFLETDDGRKALHDHLIGRLRVDRERFVPWISSLRPLEGMRILEVGCGTGASTVAMAEQGAVVTAVDIDENTMRAARARVAAYDVPVEFVVGNILKFDRLFPGRDFDLIVFYASLEHMTHEERIGAMRATWNGLKPGAYWCVVDTPNRLWWLDQHTTWLPFFQWLPDDLALQCTRFCPRPLIRDLHRDDSAEGMLAFLRKGRGVSYHEFELAMKPLAELTVASCMRLHFRRQRPLRWVKRRWTTAGKYERFLVSAAPSVPRAFFLPSLDLVLRKD
ncbi:methyltransferase domain-containing protein [bacterium]|nr:methyltransferase domain-containing protein [bacterium]